MKRTLKFVCPEMMKKLIVLDAAEVWMITWLLVDALDCHLYFCWFWTFFCFPSCVLSVCTCISCCQFIMCLSTWRLFQKAGLVKSWLLSLQSVIGRLDVWKVLCLLWTWSGWDGRAGGGRVGGVGHWRLIQCGSVAYLSGKRGTSSDPVDEKKDEVSESPEQSDSEYGSLLFLPLEQGEGNTFYILCADSLFTGLRHMKIHLWQICLWRMSVKANMLPSVFHYRRLQPRCVSSALWDICNWTLI